MSILYFEKCQPSVQRNVEKKCMLCGNNFGFTRREHQCKRCLRAVCSDCSSEKLVVYKQGYIKQPHRGCKVCVEEARETTEFIQANRLQFSRMSPLGSKWMSSIDKRALTASIDNRKHKKFTREVFMRMWDAYNYSLREFIGILTLDLEDDSVYSLVSDVVATVISTVPEEDLENVAYLSIFMLCFCSPDKAPFLCLYLLQLKSTVINEQGLLQAYMRSVGMGQSAQDMLKQFLRVRGKRFIGTLSINCISARSSIDLIQRVITKRKIEEVFIYLAICMEMLKDSISKYNLSICDLLMARQCTIQATSGKYKMPSISMVKSANFMRERNQFSVEEGRSFVSSQSSFSREQKEANNPMFASFSQGIRGNRDSKRQMPIFNPSEATPAIQTQPLTFKKRQIKEDSFIEDSFSVISMIDQMNQPSQRNQQDGNDFLNLMNQAQQKSNDSIQIKRPISISQDKTVGFPQLNLSLGDVEISNIGKRGIQCQKCISSNRTISTLMREIDDLKMQKAKNEEEYKRQIKLLQEKTKTNGNIKTNETLSNIQKMEYQSQIRKMRQALTQSQQRQKQLQYSLQKSEQSKKQQHKLEVQLRTAHQQLQQSAINIRMLRNKLQLQSFSSTQPRSTDTNDTLKINQILKQNLREKNQQIQDLSKKNKLFLYQLQQLNKQRLKYKDAAELRQKTAKLQKQREDMFAKMKELSNVLMEMEDEKLSLSEENFELKEMLRGKGVVFTHS